MVSVSNKNGGGGGTLPPAAAPARERQRQRRSSLCGVRFITKAVLFIFILGFMAWNHNRFELSMLMTTSSATNQQNTTTTTGVRRAMPATPLASNITKPPPTTTYEEQQPASTTTTATNTATGFPPSCSDDDLSTILYQLPPERCVETKRQPWMHGGTCSFTFATKCPDAVWIQNIYQAKWNQTQNHVVPKPTTTPLRRLAAAVLANGDDNGGDHDDDHQQQPFTSIYVGCNKGMDAINALRMGSRNATYDKDAWRDTFFRTHNKSQIAAGHCGQEFEPQFPLPLMDKDGDEAVVKSTVDSNAVVHCIEPLPRNSKRLSETAVELGYDSQFKVHALAMSNQDGTTYFPTETKLGDEQQGISSCNPKKGEKSGCQEVPVKTLDNFMKEQTESLEPESSSSEAPFIDLLSIDVEGYDALVLEGASTTLSRVKYLEFEYNWKGPWKKVSLSSTIYKLKDSGFVCYWAGSHGNLWQITDCWHNHYDLKFWSNVACVNVQIGSSTKELAKQMDSMFRNTLNQGRDIHYNTRETGQTNGKKAT